MKRKLRWALYLVFALMMYIAGEFWVHEKIHSVTGYLVIPLHQTEGGDDWRIVIESESKALISLSLPENELAPIIVSQKDIPPEQGRSEVKVTYQRNLWNKIVAPRIHVIAPGWIRRPKY